MVHNLESAGLSRRVDSTVVAMHSDIDFIKNYIIILTNSNS